MALPCRRAETWCEPAVTRTKSTANPGHVLPLRVLGVHDAGVDRLAVERPGPLREERVLRSFLMERRLINRALVALQAAPDGGIAPAVAPVIDNSIIVRDPAGRAMIECVAGPASACFGLVAGLALLRDPGLSEELMTACELVALQPREIQFEADMNAPIGAQILLRGLTPPLLEAGARRRWRRTC